METCNVEWTENVVIDQKIKTAIEDLQKYFRSQNLCVEVQQPYEHNANYAITIDFKNDETESQWALVSYFGFYKPSNRQFLYFKSWNLDEPIMQFSEWRSN